MLQEEYAITCTTVYVLVCYNGVVDIVALLFFWWHHVLYACCEVTCSSLERVCYHPHCVAFYYNGWDYIILWLLLWLQFGSTRQLYFLFGSGWRISGMHYSCCCCSDLTARAAVTTVTSLTLLAQKHNPGLDFWLDLHCDSGSDYYLLSGALTLLFGQH